MIAEQGQFEGSDWLSAVCGRGLAPASMPLDGQLLKIHSGVFQHLDQSCPNGMTLVCQWSSGHSDRNNTNNNHHGCVIINYQKGRRIILELCWDKSADCCCKFRIHNNLYPYFSIPFYCVVICLLFIYSPCLECWVEKYMITTLSSPTAFS